MAFREQNDEECKLNQNNYVDKQTHFINQIIKLTLKDMVKTLSTRILTNNYKNFLTIKLYGEWKTSLKLKAEAIWQTIFTKLTSLLRLRESIINKILLKKFCKWQSFTKVSKEMKNLISNIEIDKTNEFENSITNLNSELDKLKITENAYLKQNSQLKEKEKELEERLNTLSSQQTELKNNFILLKVSLLYF